MSYLAHHGILGQKWGVRRFQNPDGTYTDAGKKRYFGSTSSDGKGEGYVNRIGSKKVSEVYTNSMNKDAVKASLSAVGACKLTTMLQNSMEKSYRNNRLKELESLYNKREMKDFTEVPRLLSKMKPEDSMKLVNPEFPSTGSTMNCTFCTTAMALREKGYDVKANKLMDGMGMFTDDYFKKTFNAETVSMDKAKSDSDIIDNLRKNGDGAYGNLSVMWKAGGGHSIFWKNENGKTRIYDGQSGQEVTGSDDSYKKFMSSINFEKTVYNRLDNCEPTDYALGTTRKYGEPHKNK